MHMASRSHRGLIRVHNEDCVWCSEQDGLAILADGMGGLMAGRQASSIAVDALTQLSGNLQLTPARLLAGISQAHMQINDYAQRHEILGQIGTTVVVWAEMAWLQARRRPSSSQSQPSLPHRACLEAKKAPLCPRPREPLAPLLWPPPSLWQPLRRLSLPPPLLLALLVP